MTRYIRRKEVLQRYSISKATLSRWCAKGLFPKPVRIVEGSPTVGWPEEEIVKLERENISRQRGEKVAA